MDGREPVGVRQVTGSLRRVGSVAARIVFWNALGLGAALLVAFAVGEAYLRVAWPFARTVRPTEFVPGVGTLVKPHAEVRVTNTLDYWAVARANSLGFLDREPPSPERAAASCHVAIVGDSFVEAKHVQMSDKVQVRLERMAAERLPDWDVTVAAYGRDHTGQVSQLPFWDKWIRHRPPKLVVLFFVWNDYSANGYAPSVGDPTEAHARRTQDGSLELVTPGDSAWMRYHSLPLNERLRGIVPVALRPYVLRWVRWRRPIWRKNLSPALPSLSRPNRPPPVPTKEEEATTAFALDQWKMRAESGPSRLVVLATHTMRKNSQTRSDLEVLKEMTAERDIPVIDHMSHILDRGGNPRDASFPNDSHMTPQGHQWAAEALLEWMAANPSVCDS